MKHIIKLLTALLVALSLMAPAALPARADAAVKPKISRTETTLFVNDSVTLKVTGAKGKVKWSSSKKKVASVSAKGSVTGKKAGTATITAEVGGKKYRCKVAVRDDYDEMVKKIVVWLNGLWNGGFSEVASYIEDGMGYSASYIDEASMRLDKAISKLDEVMEEKAIYDEFISSLSDKKYKELKKLWASFGEKVDYLYAKIKEEAPRAADPTYELFGYDYEELMNEIADLLDGYCFWPEKAA